MNPLILFSIYTLIDVVVLVLRNERIDVVFLSERDVANEVFSLLTGL